MQLVFTNTYFELLLLVNGLTLLLYYAARKKKKQRAIKFGNYKTLEKVAGDDFIKTNDILLVLQILAVTMLFLAVSNPKLEKEVTGTESDYVLTIDSSATMLNNDIEPSRLEAAKKSSIKFAESTPNETKIGLISYSGKIEQEKAISTEREELIESIENVSLGEEAGSSMANALISSSTLLLDTTEPREIILLSDGRNNVGPKVNESIEFANNHNVTINSFGISLNSSSRERYERMKRVANRTGGNFTTVDSQSDISESIISQEKDTSRNSLQMHFTIIGIIILLIEWSLGTTRYDILP